MIDKLFFTAIFLLLISLVWIWLAKNKDVAKEAPIVKKVDNAFMYVFFFSFFVFVITGILRIWL